ncbi:MAG: M20 family metallopeptidase [Firmicutes bacterium]|nr:M20 family metallopeptidase [Bacillota bacterium]
MKNKIMQIAREVRSDAVALSDALYKEPELGNVEYRSSKLHAEVLKKHGFAVEMPYMGLATGYRAEFRSAKPGPHICFMAEYDALPGLGPDGGPGHGCGHNMLGATSVAAGIILSRFVAETGGWVVVLGTPAEETDGAKVAYSQKGVFRDLDAAIICHPTSGDYFKSGKSLAMDTIEFEFFGRAAHAASEPEMGINALDAVIQTFNNINALRQQTRPDARIHGIITEGGVACNVIPEHCVCRFYVRAGKKAYLKHLYQQVINCGKAAALATGCEVKMRAFELAYDDLATNEVLNRLFAQSLLELGVDHIQEPGEDYGSVDAGNVSYVCPTIHPYFPITTDAIPGHTREFAAATQTEFAKDRMMETASAMALTGYHILTEPDTLKAIRKEFKALK